MTTNKKNLEQRTDYVYELVSENLTGLGGPMGTENITDNWRKTFSTLDKAKKYAEKDYGKPLSWNRKNGRVESDDLGYVDYIINRVKIE
jgi:hypothetical protein